MTHHRKTMQLNCVVFYVAVLCMTTINCSPLDKSSLYDDAYNSERRGSNIRVKRQSVFRGENQAESVYPGERLDDGIESITDTARSLPCQFFPVDGKFHEEFSGKGRSRFQKRQSNFIRIGKSSGYFRDPLNRYRRSRQLYPLGRDYLNYVRDAAYPCDLVSVGSGFNVDNAGFSDYDKSEIFRNYFSGSGTNQRPTFLDSDNDALKRASSFVRIGKSFDDDKRASNFLRIGKSYGFDGDKVKKGSSFVRIGKSGLDTDMIHESSKKSSSFVRIGKSPANDGSFSLPYFLEDSNPDETRIDKKASSFVRIGRSPKISTKN